MSKRLADNTFEQLKTEIKKDIADPNMGDINVYYKTLTNKLDSILYPAITCKHENTKTTMTTNKTDSGGKKIVEYLETCESCGRCWHK